MRVTDFLDYELQFLPSWLEGRTGHSAADWHDLLTDSFDDDDSRRLFVEWLRATKEPYGLAPDHGLVAQFRDAYLLEAASHEEAAEALAMRVHRNGDLGAWPFNHIDWFGALDELDQFVLFLEPDADRIVVFSLGA